MSSFSNETVSPTSSPNKNKDAIVSDLQVVSVGDNGAKSEEVQIKNTRYTNNAATTNYKAAASSSGESNGSFTSKGISAFLRKRLEKGNRYFGSGDYDKFSDYYMANQTSKRDSCEVTKQQTLIPPSTGNESPTTDTVSKRKMSMTGVKLYVGSCEG